MKSEKCALKWIQGAESHFGARSHFEAMAAPGPPRAAARAGPSLGYDVPDIAEAAEVAPAAVPSTAPPPMPAALKAVDERAVL